MATMNVHRSETPRRQHATLTKIVMLVVLLALIIGGIYWWRNRDRTETTTTAPRTGQVELNVEQAPRVAGLFEGGSLMRADIARAGLR